MSGFKQEFYDRLLALEDSSLAETYLIDHPKEIQKVKFQIWPLKLKWYQHKRFDLIKKNFKFLEPILIEIGNLKFHLSYTESNKLLSNKPYDFQQRHMICVNGVYRVPAFMKQNCKVGIAKRVGCSVSSIEDYLRGLVRIGILKSHNLGGGLRLYSIGYWMEYKDKEGIKRFKINYFMNQTVGKELINFYLRKPKN